MVLPIVQTCPFLLCNLHVKERPLRLPLCPSPPSLLQMLESIPKEAADKGCLVLPLTRWELNRHTAKSETGRLGKTMAALA